MVDYNRVVVSGTLGGGADIWSCGFNFAPDIGPMVIAPEDLTAWAEAIATSITTLFPAALSNGLSSDGMVTLISCYYYADHTGPATSVGVADSTRTGSGSTTLPLSTACVASLRTALSGRRYRGRIFWPAVGWEVDPDGTFDATIWGPFTEDVAEFMGQIADAAPLATDLRPVVLSVAGGFVTPVTSITADNGPDTQRRRDDDVADATQSSPYPPA